MENDIKEIIEKATELKREGKSDLDIAKFVHLELGNILIYDNSYSANFVKNESQELDNVDKNSQLNGNQEQDHAVNQLNGDEKTELTKNRQEKLLADKTDTSKKAQICKGMAEIYSATLDKVGIKSKVVGVESKGDIDGDIREDKRKIDVPEIYRASLDDNFQIVCDQNEKENDNKAEHYYTIIEIDGKKYAQDFLIDKTLFRIKTGEASMGDKIPGLCPIEEYKSRADKDLPLSDEYLKKIANEYYRYANGKPNTDTMFQFLFEKLKQYNNSFGFEENKDFFNTISKEILTNKEIFPNDLFPADFIGKDFSFINFVKENQSLCDIITLYGYKDNFYLLRGGDENSSIPNIDIGKVAKIRNLMQILEQQGFEPRKIKDLQTLEDLNLTLSDKKQNAKTEAKSGQSKITMKEIVSEAINGGITKDDVNQAERIEKTIEAERVEGTIKKEANRFQK